MKIQNRKLLVSGYLTNRIYPLLMKEDDVNASFGVKVDNIYSLMDENDYAKLSSDEIVFMIHRRFKEDRKDYPVFGRIIDNVRFIGQIYAFYQECVWYGIDIDSLPQDSDEEKEIKRLLQTIDDLDIDVRRDYEDLRKNVAGHEVLTQFSSSFNEYKLLQQCAKISSRTYELLKDEQLKKVDCFKASTRGKELERIADLIMDDPDKSIQVVAVDDMYMEDIARVFSAHDIPFRRVSYRYESIIIRRLMDLVKMLKVKDNESIVKVLRYVGKNKDLCDYADHFKVEAHEFLEGFARFKGEDYDELLQIDDQLGREKDRDKRSKLYERKRKLISENKLFDLITWENAKQLIVLERKAEERRKEILDDLERWLKGDPYDSLLKYYNELVSVIDWKQMANDLPAFQKAGSLIVRAQNCEGDLEVLYQLLSSIKVTDPNVSSAVVSITDMDHLLPGKDLTIVVGANEGSFMASAEKEGIIKEDYVAKIAEYPTLIERLDYIKQKVALLKKISSEVVLSYCYSNYEGKEKKLSNYIEEAFGIEENRFTEKTDDEPFEYHQEKPKTIAKEKAKDLFVSDDGGIAGSVSSLEIYRKCPYRYFLQKGIGLEDKRGYQQLDAAMFGTLRHKIFEELGKVRFKDEKLLGTLLQEYTDILKQIYTDEADLLAIRQRAMKDILELNMEIERRLEAEGMETVKQEYRIDREPVPAGDYHFDFTAIVDRIDQGNGYFRIIDYKSTQTKLNMNSFRKGEQLQLLTYLWLVWKKKAVAGDPLGAFYFDLDATNIQEKAKDIEKDTQDEGTMLDVFVNKNKLQGWYVSDASSSKLITKAQASYDEEPEFALDTIEGIDKCLSKLYKDIATDITDGKMTATPSDAACRFCNYAPICHKEESEEKEDDDAE